MASIENKAGSSTKRLSLIAALLLVLSLIVLGFYSSKNKTASQTAGEQVAEPRRLSAYQLPEPDIDEQPHESLDVNGERIPEKVFFKQRPQTKLKTTEKSRALAKSRIFGSEDQAVLAELVGCEVKIEGEVLYAKTSNSGKTGYLVFSSDRPQLCGAVSLTRGEVDFEWLKKLTGKTIILHGIVDSEQSGDFERRTLRFNKKSAIKLVD